ncbi:WD40 repeat-containing protein [Dictyostelium discoideum AX4]|uniref:WD40 repeat-containing protein n=1 Tax=Dictyostelium discoideum TaxID=44689 RepID=Q550V0_DICDI|nr:WD40 repeat-containing protein [Dictyostelium discoideum AX4]EAL69011.1 WD40 repeat-containing protein [Dictyostelium discoideum AX4]|eukprot:XP_642832.1 WD40 repeat-containing protein [Dictyostelium discoideum AX4]
MESGSQIFLPYKSVGYVSSGVPFKLRAEKLHYSIMLAIGNSFQLLNSIKLFPRMVSNSQEGKIRDMSFYKKDHFLTTCKKDIILWKGQYEEFRFRGHSSKVIKLMVFDNILFSLAKNNELIMWDVDSRLIFKEQLPEFNAKTHRITEIVHPLGYYNKILIGFESGEAQIWNIKTKKLIFTFNLVKDNKNIKDKITSFQQSPVSDIIAIGFSDGNVIIHNLKLNKTVLSFQQRGSVSSISFRSDGQKQHVATSSHSGDILIWDLEKNKPFHTLKAHDSECTKVEFLREEPIICTTGNDNSIKMWQFNGVDGVPILLRERTGHLDPPKSSEFFGDEQENSVISISDQSIRYVSIVASTFNKELSKKNFKKEMTPFSGFSTNFRRNRSWETAVSIHEDSKHAFTWDCSSYSINKKLNIQEPISSTKISTCGNFVFFGTVYGNLLKFNIQSGIKRAKILPNIQKTSITSIIVEPTNQFIITSGLDSIINYWDFNDLKYLYSIDINNTNTNNKENQDNNNNDNKKSKIRISKMLLHSESGIFAVVSNDDKIRLYDIDTRKLVRYFNVKGNVNSIVFSHDGRWIIASTQVDSVVRVLDIPSGKMIDWFKMPKPVTSLSFSPKGEYLVTTHSGQLPIYLWSNQSHFGSVFLKTPPQIPNTIILPSQVIEISPIQESSNNKQKSSTKKLKEKEQHEQDEEFEIQQDLGLPEEFDEEMEDNQVDNNDNDADDNKKSTIKQIDQLITLSSDVAKSKWQSLLNLDIIKERNRPIQQNEKPALAPFFLSTIQGLEPKFAKIDVVNPLTIKTAVSTGGGGSANTTGSTDDNENNGEPTEEELKGWDNWAGADDEENDDDDDDEDNENDDQDEDSEDDEDEGDEDLEKTTETFKNEKEIYRSDKVIKTDSLQGTRTNFNLSLENGYITQNYSESLRILKSLTPSGIDFEIRTLTTADDYADIHYMFDFIVYQLLKNGDYDFIQSILSVTLKVHGYLLYDTTFKRDLRQLLLVFNEPWFKMQKLFHSNICMLRYFTNTLNN